MTSDMEPIVFDENSYSVQDITNKKAYFFIKIFAPVVAVLVGVIILYIVMLNKPINKVKRMIRAEFGASVQINTLLYNDDLNGYIAFVERNGKSDIITVDMENKVVGSSNDWDLEMTLEELNPPKTIQGALDSWNNMHNSDYKWQWIFDYEDTEKFLNEWEEIDLD